MVRSCAGRGSSDSGGDWFVELIVVALVLLGFFCLFFPPISLVLWFVAFVMHHSNQPK